MNFKISVLIMILIIISTIIIFSIIKKRILFVSIVIMIPLMIYECIMYFDQTYYIDMVSGIDDVDYYVFLLSLLIFLILIFEICVNILIGEKRKVRVNRLMIDKPKDKNEFGFSNSLDFDIAYYDELSDSYYLNNHFKLTLNRKNNVIRKSDLCKMILPKDKEEFLNSNEEIIKFRLFLKNGFKWYQEKRINQEGINYITIYELDKDISTFDLVDAYNDLLNRTNAK